MAEMEAIGKSRKNQAQGYSFRGIDEVYNELHPILARNKVFTTTEVLDQHREERPTKSGGNMTFSVFKIKFTFFAEDGSSVSCVMIGEGSDSGDKSSNKAMAVAHKYAFVQVFSIPTVDDKDPENYSPEPLARTSPTPPAQKSPAKLDSPLVTEAQLKRLYAISMQKGWTTAHVKDELFKMGVKDSTQLNRVQYDELISIIQGDNMGDIPH